MRFFISVGLLGFMTVMALNAQNRAGEYAASVPEVATGLLLRPDGKFAYYFTYGAADYMAEGTWKSQAGAIVLETDGTDEKPFRLLKSAAGSASEIQVHVQAPNGRGVANMDVTITTASGESKERTDNDGVAAFPPGEGLKSVALHVPVYEVNAGPFPVPDGSREFWFEINGNAITRVPFRKERLKVTDKGLELSFWNPDRPLVYRKVK